jgi:hypothetical protein
MPSPVEASPEASPASSPAPSTAPVEVEHPKGGESSPESTVAIALAGGDLRVGPSREKATKVAGSVVVSNKDTLYVASGVARFRVGETDVLLSSSSEAHLAAGASHPQLVLDKGAVFAEGSSPDLDLACHGARAQPITGASTLLLRAAPDGAALLLCVEGHAMFSTGTGGSLHSFNLGPGQASEAEPGGTLTRPHDGDLNITSWFDDARAERAQATGLDYPRGFLARAAVVALKGRLAAEVPLAERARALYAIESARAADERIARVAELASTEADRAFDDITNAAASDPVAAPAAALALFARASRLGAKAEPEFTKRMTKLLATCRATLEKSGRATSDLELALALQACRSKSARLVPLPSDETLQANDLALAKDPVANPLDARWLLTADRGFALAGDPRDDERRFARVLAQLASRGRKGCASSETAADALLVLSRDAHRFVGRRPVEGAPSVVVLERGDKFEVTFVVESAKHPRQIILEGSWDGWKADKPPMTSRHDGTFVETVVLPRGRHQYKLRPDGAKAWEPDAKNPFVQDDGHGGVNSVLDLE